jgi:hypothetical protein
MTDLCTPTIDERLETPKQLAARVGLSERQVRHLIQSGQLEHVLIGCRVHIPVGAFARFLKAKKVLPCQDEIGDRISTGTGTAPAGISPGPSEAAAASAALARQTARKLKSLSPNSCNSGTDEPVRVIPLRSS